MTENQNPLLTADFTKIAIDLFGDNEKVAILVKAYEDCKHTQEHYMICFSQAKAALGIIKSLDMTTESENAFDMCKWLQQQTTRTLYILACYGLVKLGFKNIDKIKDLLIELKNGNNITNRKD